MKKMVIISLIVFCLTNYSAAVEYEVTRSTSEVDRIVWKENKTNICETFRAKEYYRTESEVICTCPSDSTFYSLHSESPACYPSNAGNLGCICSGANCASLITPNLSMIRGLQSNKTWCNNEPKPTYRIKVWTPNGWKTFSRPDDMVVRFSVEGDIGKLKFQWKIDGFSGISHYSGNLFLITVSCNSGNVMQCFLAKSPGTKLCKLELNYVTIDNQYNYRSIDVTLLLRTVGMREDNSMKPSAETDKNTPDISQGKSTGTEVTQKSLTLILIGSIGGLILIINLAIMVKLMFRRKLSDKTLQEAPSFATPTIPTAREFHSRSNSPNDRPFQNTTTHYSHVKPTPPERRVDAEPTYYITPNDPFDIEIDTYSTIPYDWP